MNAAQELGLLMLIHVSHPPHPDYHAMTDRELRREISRLRQEVDMLAQHWFECRAAVVQVHRERDYQADQLDYAKGVMQVRKLDKDQQRWQAKCSFGEGCWNCEIGHCRRK